MSEKRGRSLNEILNKNSAHLAPFVERVAVPLATASVLAQDAYVRLADASSTIPDMALGGLEALAALPITASVAISQNTWKNGKKWIKKNKLKNQDRLQNAGAKIHNMASNMFSKVLNSKTADLATRYIPSASTLALLGNYTFENLDLDSISRITDLESFLVNAPNIAKGLANAYITYMAASGVHDVMNSYPIIRGIQGKQGKSKFPKSPLWKGAAALAVSIPMALTANISDRLQDKYLDFKDSISSISQRGEVERHKIPRYTSKIPNRVPKTQRETYKPTTRRTIKSIIDDEIENGYKPIQHSFTEGNLDITEPKEKSKRQWIEEQRKSVRFEMENLYFAKYWDIDSDFLRAITATETIRKQFYKNGKTVRSWSAAYGLGQHIIDNFLELERLFRVKGYGKSESHARWSFKKAKNDPIHNLDATAATLRFNGEMFGYNNDLVAASYNLGKTKLMKTIRKVYKDDSWKSDPDAFFNVFPHIRASKAKKREVMGYVLSVRNYLEMAQNIVWPTDSSKILFRSGEYSYKGIKIYQDGVDIAPASGENVYSTADGIVSKVRNDKKNGNWIEIIHGDDRNGFLTQYLHLDDIDVTEGQKVKSGQHIGEIGDTGDIYQKALHYKLHMYMNLKDAKTRKSQSDMKFVKVNPLDIHDSKNFPNGDVKFYDDDTPEERRQKEKIKRFFYNRIMRNEGKYDKMIVDDDQHVVRKNQLAPKIAQRYFTTLDELQEENPDIDLSNIDAGQIINLPDTFKFHTVSSGENFFDIGGRYGIDYKVLKAANGYKNNNLKTTDVLIVPK